MRLWHCVPIKVDERLVLCVLIKVDARQVLTAKDTHVPVIANRMKISNHLASVIWGWRQISIWWQFQFCYRYAELSYRVFQFEEEDGSLGPIWWWFDAGSSGRLLHRFRFLRLSSCGPTRLQKTAIKFNFFGSRWGGKSNLNERGRSARWMHLLVGQVEQGKYDAI